MEIINYEIFRKEFIDFAIENNEPIANDNIIRGFYNDFVNLMKEDVNANKTAESTQKIFAQDFAHSYYSEENYEKYKRRYSDNKHLNFFDVNLYDGASIDIENALNKYGIPTSILKGIKYAKNHSYSRDEVEVQMLWSTDENSPVVESFEITYNGNVIFSYKGKEQNFYNINDIVEELKKEKTKTNKIVKVIKENFDNINIEKEIRVSKKGKKYYQYRENGKFISEQLYNEYASLNRR